MIKLVASDIDGTLLVAGKKELSPEIYDIILELKRENITFVAASGRQLESLRKLFGPIENDIFLWLKMALLLNAVENRSCFMSLNMH